MKKLIAVVIVVPILFFSSCVGIKSTVHFNRDGTGTIFMEYRISKMLTEMAEEEGDAPLPISEDELKTAVAQNPNLELKSVTQTEDDQDVYISAEIGFKNIDEFTDMESFAAMPMSLEKRGNEYIFRQLVSEGEEENSEEDEELDDETLEAMAAFFEGYDLTFSVQTPTDITYHSLGELSSDKRGVTYSIPLLEMDSLKEETILEVKWRS